MANKFTYQVLRDTTTEAIIKLTAVFDGSSNESNVSRIAANTLNGSLDANGVMMRTSSSKSNTALSFYNLQLTGLKYYVNFPTSQGASGAMGSVEVFWTGSGINSSTQYANSATILHLNGDGEFGLGEQLPAIYNNSIGGNGDFGVTTYGAVANSSYTLIAAFRKDNAMYQRGQFSDPAAFNAPPYNLQP